VVCGAAKMGNREHVSKKNGSIPCLHRGVIIERSERIHSLVGGWGRDAGGHANLVFQVSRGEMAGMSGNADSARVGH